MNEIEQLAAVVGELLKINSTLVDRVLSLEQRIDTLESMIQ